MVCVTVLNTPDRTHSTGRMITDLLIGEEVEGSYSPGILLERLKKTTTIFYQVTCRGQDLNLGPETKTFHT
jgi:hypothetical protein